MVAGATPRQLARKWHPELVAGISGALLPLAYAPFSYYPVSFLSVAALFWFWLTAPSAKRAFVRGYLFALGYFGLGVSWVSVSMVRYGGVPLPLAFALTALFVLFLALYTGLAGYFSRRWFAQASTPVQLLVVFPFFWVLMEWVRAWFLTGFPWLSLGYSQTDSPLAALASVGGVFAVSLAVAVCAGALVALWRESGKRRVPYLILVVALWLTAWISASVEWVKTAGQPLKVSLLQGNIAQNIKWQPDQREPTINLYLQMTREHWDSDIIIWPETAMPVFYHQAREFIHRLAEEARDKHTSVLMGIPLLEDATEAEPRYYNSVLSIHDGGLQFYSKYHLVPFGEFTPFKSVLGGLLDFMNIPMADFSRSEAHQPVVPAAGYKAAVSICYEDAFGEEVIVGLPVAHMLVNVSNDTWFGDSLAPHQHLQMARMRSIETGRPMLRATNNGVSALIDYKGRITATSPQFKQTVLTGLVQPMTGTTPYVLWGNYLIVVILVAGLSLVFLSARGYLPLFTLGYQK